MVSGSSPHSLAQLGASAHDDFLAQCLRVLQKKHAAATASEKTPPPQTSTTALPGMECAMLCCVIVAERGGGREVDMVKLQPAS
jgi:hypothetical protein